SSRRYAERCQEVPRRHGTERVRHPRSTGEKKIFPEHRLSDMKQQFSEGIKDDVRGSTVHGVNEEELGTRGFILISGSAVVVIVTPLCQVMNSSVHSSAWNQRPPAQFR